MKQQFSCASPWLLPSAGKRKRRWRAAHKAARCLGLAFRAWGLGQRPKNPGKVAVPSFGKPAETNQKDEVSGPWGCLHLKDEMNPKRV